MHEELPGFEALAAQVRERGEPYDGITLRHTAGQARVACRQCGSPPEGHLEHWAQEWLALCQQARRHALARGQGHEVAVSLWLGAVYVPVGADGEALPAQ